MMIHALVIAPYKGLFELVSGLKEELSDFRLTMLQGDLSEVLPLVGQMEEGQYDVIVSRGGTARLLRQLVTIPVIEIHVSGYDMMRILTLVQGISSRVEMIGFPNVIDGFIAVSRIMGIDIPYTEIGREEEASQAVARAKEKGVGVVLGDTVTVRKAQELGMEGILITSGKEAVLEAFAQARYMRTIAARYEQKYTVYEHLLDKLDAGLAVLNEQNRFQYVNDAFCAQWGISGDKPLHDAPIERGTCLSKLITCLKLGIDIDRVALTCRPAHSTPMLVSAAAHAAEAGFYYVQSDSKPDSAAEHVLSVSFWTEAGQGNTFLQPLGQTANAGSLAAGDAPDGLPIAVYGEKGSGKRLWSAAWSGGEHTAQAEQERLFIAAELPKAGKLSLITLEQWLARLDQSAVLYLKGVEDMDASQQNALAEAITAAQAQVILSFERSPGELRRDGHLGSALFELLQDRIRYFPPLRDRRDELEALIRSLIAKSNETSGKQIVGLRPDVLNSLLERPWAGNFNELKETIDRLVHYAKGDFIDESALAGLEHDALSEGWRNTGSGNQAGISGGINLNQTLEAIERDVIQAVLKQEQMNQSNAAKRLGINRSTLWRKLKQNEHES
ncbi:PrpR N-terminal domain-containing protein [Paenibacillus piri]|uniref:PAS domain-containing protein n=1 Tax=Paenibacillus piri TaxID=2547395 RepID=A0A4R5KXG6_9BACL|nr:PrpR N-terminal domain-containing protein [Paenibacillus piri]TDF99767.1 PAS domain-containing protein [Paenibacillus piri]